MAASDIERTRAMPDSQPTTRVQRFLSTLARLHRPVAYALLAAALLLAALCFWIGVVFDSETRFGYRINWPLWPEAGGALLLALVAAAAGAWLLLTSPARRTVDNLRALVLAAGGLSGLIIFLATIGRAARWWTDIFAKGLEGWQGEGGWKLWVCIAAALFGLAVMFASLLLARSEERSNVIMRRLLYGYNSALAGLLLLAILVLVNIMVRFLFPATYNWTKTRASMELSSRAKSVLQHLDENVYVYVIMSPQGRIYGDLRILLDNCEAVTDKLVIRTISPDRQPEAVKNLIKRLPSIQVVKADPRMLPEGVERGIALVRGAPGSPNEQLIAFIPENRLYQSQRTGADTQTLVFKGEDVLLSELSFGAEGGKKRIVYFTLDHGELAFNPKIQGQIFESLRTQLQRDKFKIRGLGLRQPPPGYQKSEDAVISKQVPKDADVVVIADPLRPFLAEAVEALRRYLARGGTLFIMLDIIHGNQVDARPSGLEKLLTEYNVEVQKAYVLRNSEDDPLTVLAFPPSESDNRIARAMTGTGLRFTGVRPVRRLSNSPRYRVDTVLEVPVALEFWVETDLAFHPRACLIERRKSGTPVSKQPAPVAVAVRDAQSDKPKLVVCGNMRFLRQILGPNPTYYDFFHNCIQWLRGRGADLGISPIKSERYVLDTANTNLSRLRLLPVFLILVAIIGLGTGIWVVRRR
jgi:hypothetical protein